MAQKSLPTHIRENTTLNEGVYQISGTHYVSKGTVLTITGNVTLLFDENATIRVDGGLKILGEPNKLINITSSNKNLPGNGFVINGVSTTQSVDISYARFDFIKKPVTFEFRWSRNRVNISNNVIKRSLYEGAAIEIKEHDNLLTPSKMQFTFKDNTFCNSTSSLLISNITADLLTIDFDNNVITRNEYTGRSRNGIFTSPLYMTYNQYQSNDVPNLSNNSIFDNFYSLFYEDTFDIGRTNVSIVGNADKLNLSGNYFGDPDKREIEESFDYISANYQAPFLFVDNTLQRPSNELNGHFYNVLVNGTELDEKLIFSSYKGEINNIDMQFNRPVIDGKNYATTYHYLSGDSIISVLIPSRLKWSEGNQHLKIVITESLKKYGKIGYMEVDGLYDSDGMDVPILTIGKKGLIDQKIKTLIPINIPSNPTNKKDAEVSPDDTLVVFDPTEKTFMEFESLNDSFVHLREKYWDYGVYAGNALYFGDLNGTVISASPRNMRPSAGISVGYQATEKWRFSLRNNYSLIAGSDLPRNEKNKNLRGTGFDRNMSFRTFVADANLLAEYNITRFKLKSSIVPSVFAGANVYYFNPQSQVEGDEQWYNLRSVGTGGQTLDGSDRYIETNEGVRLAYRRVMLGIPMGVSIKKHITQKTIVSLSYTYVNLFTDYLDDVGTDLYPKSADIESANTGLDPGYATALSNPGNQSTRISRSYSDDYDGYGYWGINFSFKIY